MEKTEKIKLTQKKGKFYLSIGDKELRRVSSYHISQDAADCNGSTVKLSVEFTIYSGDLELSMEEC